MVKYIEFNFIMEPDTPQVLVLMHSPLEEPL